MRPTRRPLFIGSVRGTPVARITKIHFGKAAIQAAICQVPTFRIAVVRE
jgi:hypothetical protein